MGSLSLLEDLQRLQTQREAQQESASLALKQQDRLTGWFYKIFIIFLGVTWFLGLFEVYVRKALEPTSREYLVISKA